MKWIVLSYIFLKARMVVFILDRPTTWTADSISTTWDWYILPNGWDYHLNWSVLLTVIHWLVPDDWKGV